MTPTLVAGGLTEDDLTATQGGKKLILHYVAQTPSVAPGASYPISLSSGRLSAVLRRGDRGWIARAPDLDGLGYGDSEVAALDDLAESIRQYLEFLRDDQPDLAPAIAHHAGYVGLLDTPQWSWFISVSVEDAPAVE
jgi:hypothetical protein